MKVLLGDGVVEVAWDRNPWENKQLTELQRAT